MSTDIEAIAKAWMAHQGYSLDDIEVAETDTHQKRGCDWHGTSWYCFDEYGNSNHPALDVLEEATEMARVAIEALGQSHAIVELPKPHRAEEDELEDGDDPRVWRGHVTNYFIMDGQVSSDGAWIFTADGARKEAAALLAAANASEVSS